MIKTLLYIGAILSIAAVIGYSGSVGNQPEGGGVRDYPALIGGIRADAKAQHNHESVPVSGSHVVVSNMVMALTPATLYWLDFENGSGAANFIQVFDAAALPANGEIPLVSIPVAASASVFRRFEPPIWCATGVVIAGSTTQATLTIGAADKWITAGVYPPGPTPTSTPTSTPTPTPTPTP